MRYPWRDFLETWNQELLASPRLQEARLPQEFRAQGWLGLPPAPEADISALEARLGQPLPPSYRQFLAFSDGWMLTGTFIYRLWSAQQVDWFRVRNADWIEAYLRQTRQLPLPPYESSVIQETLEISDVGDAAIYLLNPLTVNAEGEWEAWLFANWQDNVQVYPSFWDLMQAEYRSFRQLESIHRRRHRYDGHLEVVKHRLEYLILELRQYINIITTQAKAEAAQSNGQSLYLAGTVAILEETSARLVELGQAAVYAPNLLETVRGMANAHERQWRALAVQYGEALKHASSEDLQDAIRRSGEAEGHRQAAARLDWFLGGGDAGATRI